MTARPPTSAPPGMDLKALRAQLHETAPDDLIGCLAIFLEASAEHARELKLAPEQFVKAAVDAYAEANGKVVTTFECCEEFLGKDAGIEVVLGLGAKWRSS